MQRKSRLSLLLIALVIVIAMSVFVVSLIAANSPQFGGNVVCSVLNITVISGSASSATSSTYVVTTFSSSISSGQDAGDVTTMNATSASNQLNATVCTFQSG